MPDQGMNPWDFVGIGYLIVASIVTLLALPQIVKLSREMVVGSSSKRWQDADATDKILGYGGIGIFMCLVFGMWPLAVLGFIGSKIYDGKNK